MTLPVPLPHMGVSVEEATVVTWHKAVGETVREGEALCDISTDKVETEIASPADGVLARIVAAAGETVPVGAVLAELAASAEDLEPTPPAPEAEPSPAAGSGSPGEPSAARGPASPAANAEPRAAGVQPQVVRFDPARAARAVLETGRPNGRGPVSSPVARRLAAEHGVELGRVTGTGMRGRIRKADVLAAIDATSSAPRAPAASAPPAPAASALPGADALPRGYDDVPHTVLSTSRVRRATAEHMIRSRQTAAHMTTEAEVDMAAALRAREVMNAERAAGGRPKITPLALIARAACVALAEYPDLNATFETERLIRWNEVNLGIAVDTPDGLLVPVIRRAERLTAPALADAIADLAARARERRLSPEDVRAGTFTISNPGSVGAASAMAIINQPQVGILGLPAIVRRPAVVTGADGEETIGIRPMMMLALTFDHRAIDGAYATRAVVRIKTLLESWDVRAYA